MVDMKRTAAEKKADQERWNSAPMGSEGEDYPYELRICLDTDELEKLKLKPLKVGARVSLSGFADVVSVSMSDGTDGERRTMTIQITDLEMSPQDEKSAASAFYGDDTAGGL